MKKCRLFIISSLFVISSMVLAAQAQKLDDQRIWKLPNDKRSIFLDQGVFHYKSKKPAKDFKVVRIRNSYKKTSGYERIVFDFNTNDIPSLYGHISKDDKKVKIDLFKTLTTNKELSVPNSRFIKGVDFFNLQDDTSIEIRLKEKVVFDVFFLKNPGRIVVDIRR